MPKFAGVDRSKYSIGDIIAIGTTALPFGTLPCNGAAVSRTTFAGLFAVVGTAYGVGDGSTTFNVPDSQGRTLIGDGTGAGLSARSLGQSTGEETHLLSTGELPSHNHGVNDPTHAHDLPTTGLALSGGANNTPNHVDNATPRVTTFGVATGITIQNAGGGAVHNNMQPSVVVRRVIAYI